MFADTRFARRLVGGAAVLVASLTSVSFVRGIQRAPVEAGPGFREKGGREAPIVIVEFSDFQCPACRLAEEPLRQIVELYGSRVRLVFKHFPLERVHPWARGAARAADCAGRQGRFWPYHDRLYRDQAEWASSDDPSSWWKRYAKDLRLDGKAFSACLQAPETDAAVEADAREGRERWVGSTPTFFINRKRFIGARQLSTRGSLFIEKELKR